MKSKWNRTGISLVLCLALSASFSGCNQKQEVQTSASQSDETDKQATSDSIADTAPSPEAGTTQSQKTANTITADQSFALNLGETASVPDTASDATYSSKDESIATVDPDGTIHAQGKGTTQISSLVGEENTVYCVKVRKKGMVYPSFSMMKGEVLALQFSNAVSHISWTSADPSVAKVAANGKIKARHTGSTVISGTVGKHTYACDLTVTRKIKSVIHLTFDDGPNRYSTPKILNILKKNHVKATFFELRPAGNDFDLTKRVIDEGHTLGLHGFSHKYDQIYKSEAIYHDNLDKLQSLFFRKFGVWCTVSRFPGGSSNTVSRYNPGIMTKLSKDVEDWGYHYFDWNVSSGDAGGTHTPEEVFRAVKSQLMKGHENVVLMHDFANNDKTINALDRVIKYGKRHGFTFLPITASTEEIHHGVNN